MTEAKEFFRICPACGRRFHIKLVSKNLVDKKKETVEVSQSTLSPAPGGYAMTRMSPVMVEENIPIVVDVEEFQYSYKCKHCGHEWSEIHTDVSKV